MPRPKKPGAPEPKRRSRNGCWPCKARKVKCGEEKPLCVNCQRQGEQCDYSIRLNWEGRARKKSTANSIPSSSVFSSAPVTSAGRPTSGPGPVFTASEFVQVQPQQSQTERPQSSTGGQLLPAKRTVDNNAGQEGNGWRNSPAQHPSKDSKEQINMASPVFIPHSNRGPQAPSNRNDFQIYPSPPAGVSKEDPQPSLSMTFPAHSRGPSYPSPSSSVLTNTTSPGPFNQVSFKGYPPTSNPQQPISHLRQPPSPRAHSSNSPVDSSDISQRHNAKRIKLTNHSSFYGQRDIQPLRHPPPPPSSYPNSSVTMPGDPNYIRALPPANPRHSTAPNQNAIFSSAESSDSTSDDSYPQYQPVISTEDLPTPTDIQRVSVQSLLSHSAATTGALANHSSHQETLPVYDQTFPTGSIGGPYNHGLDCGRPDLDVHRNDDSTAIEHNILTEYNTIPTPGSSGGGHEFDTATNASSPDANVHLRVTTVFAKGGYYAKPVPINIPQHLSPLPPALLDYPINLLYFHHFMNHTGRILVPHDCSKNPFANVLPAMAIEDTNLLHLLLAYSASHRARLLGHAEPYNRIAHWTRHVFPSLRHALNDPNEKISDTSLATAIMLVSLKIISPSTFEVPIPWENHLKLAREIFLARREAHQDNPSSRVVPFLGRWLGYLDIFGSLSSRQTLPPLYNGVYWSPESQEEEAYRDNEFEIDCFTGYTRRTCSLLARLAELTHQCDNVRVDPSGRLFTSWNPPPHALNRAEKLLQDMNDSSPLVSSIRTHHGVQAGPGMAAMDEAYRLAGVINLHRRVLGRSASDPLITDLVDSLIETLNLVSRGGQEEVCALFPLFTAGCEAQDAIQRQEIRNRVKGFEGVGMKQIRRARKLMQRSWQEGLPWTVLANGEFLG